MAMQQCDIGIIGLGVMGSNLALNMASHGFTVAGFNRNIDKVQALQQEAGGLPLKATNNLTDFVAMLKTPRIVLLMVSAGSPVDDVMTTLTPLLSAGDIVVDGGNSHFTDTDRRQADMEKRGLRFIGMGISGGEEGARKGPCMMPGGPREAYEAIHPIMTACAAHIQNEPCVAYLGPGSAGHYVKMVHNGIEYGLMQLIAETYDVMKRGLGLNDDELHAQYKTWNDSSALNSFLLEITANIFLQPNGKPDQRLIDLIRDEARQKGTGTWTSEDAFKLQVPIPTIDAAVMMRDLSADKSLRQTVNSVLKGPADRFSGDRSQLQNQLKNAFHAAMILTYAQGMALLQKASAQYGYALNLYEVARIWRGGCIIRAAMLEQIAAAYQRQPDLPLLFLDPDIATRLSSVQTDLRSVVQTAAMLGIPVPGLMASLGYYDASRSAWLPANLIQAQRDYFGAHTYERIDKPGTFHTQWLAHV